MNIEKLTVIDDHLKKINESKHICVCISEMYLNYFKLKSQLCVRGLLLRNASVLA